MNRIDLEKCEKIYADIKERHCTVELEHSANKAWGSSIFEVEKELFDMMFIKNEITADERNYIFGKVCLSALSCGRRRFFRDENGGAL